MLKKCLIALALVAFCSAPVMADYTWAATTHFIWEWAEKECCRIPVKVHVVMWAQLYCPDELILVQQPDSGNFLGCADVELCVNFEGIFITAEFKENQNNFSDKYMISLDSSADGGVGAGGKGNSASDGWNNNPKTTIGEANRHLTGDGNLIIELCLEAKNIDPQAMAYTGDDQLHQIGEIIMTVQPIGVVQSGPVPPYIPGA